MKEIVKKPNQIFLGYQPKKNNDEEEITQIKKEEKWGEDYYFKILNRERYILLYSPIEDESADILVTKIKAMNYLDNKRKITIEINSPGGDISAGFTIINAIEQSEAPIHTICSGEACSMAALIFITAKKRKMYHNSYIMFHPLQEGQCDYLQYIKDRVKFLTQLEKTMSGLCKKYTKLTSLDMHKMNAGELWLTAQEALQKKVCDEII